MKKKEPIPRVCATCQHARLLAKEESTTPPLVRLLSYTEDSEDIILMCPYNKNASPYYGCRRFRFDAVKYRPKKSPAPISLSEDDVL